MSRWPSGLGIRLDIKGLLVRYLADTSIFILNFRFPPLQISRAVANEIKHDHSPVIIVVLDPQTRLIIRGVVYLKPQYSFNFGYFD